MSETCLVVGATGILGSEICRLLTGRGHKVRALVRSTSDPSKRGKLKEIGGEFAEGDLKDGDSLDRACRGISVVISTASSTLSRQTGDSIESVDRDGQLRLVDAARKAGVRQFIFISFRNNPDIQHPLTDAKQAVTRRLKESGLDYTILEASYFMEIWLSPALGFDYPNAKARIYGPGRNKLSWISFADVAQFAVAAVGNPAASKMVLEIGGPEALSPLEVVKIFEAASGQKFAVEHVPEEALRAQKAAAADSLQQAFAALMLTYAAGDAVEMRETLKAFPLRLTSVRDYAARALAS
jgi:NADH dehydrogenase